jgi:hypothetical protein
VDFISKGRGSRSVEAALEASERRVDELVEELVVLRARSERVFKPPPREWIEARLTTLQNVLEQRTTESALVLREVLGEIVLTPIKPDIGSR